MRVASEAVSAVTDDLEPGERAAIALAETLHADLLLIDEAAGPAGARRRHLYRLDFVRRVLTTGAWAEWERSGSWSSSSADSTMKSAVPT